MSLVRFKHQDSVEALALGTECLAIRQGPSAAADQRFLLLQRMAQSAERLGRHAVAVEHYRAVLERDAAQAAPLLDDAQRLGVLARIGRSLHDDGRFAEAAATHREMLADAEVRFGHDDERLGSVLNNLAQNLYKLGQLEEMQALLPRRLAMAESASGEAMVDDTLFVLGGIVLESGCVEQACDWMGRRVRRAVTTGDAARIENARADAAELERRSSADGQAPRL